MDSEDKAMRILDKLKNDVRFFKVGLELFSSCGPGIVRRIKEAGCEVFLDLKFHDIPNTVAKAAVSAAGLSPFMFNVHALGGYDMMKRTAEAVAEEAKKSPARSRPKVLAVTILTSMDEKALSAIGIKDKVEKAVLRLAEMAKSAGLDGVVASPAETALIREKLGKSFLIVTPGVRPAWAAVNDQKRIATPKDAIAAGADFIVVGRPITEASDPAEAVKKILSEMK
ncbi:MAG: orotidine-5'-phosphate decarboxylase [Candidatus Omnitrophica bacterium]|nr:orotidine-5'-phosphate decarboxylase [Candidatus Omnitrophota bacterium]